MDYQLKGGEEWRDGKLYGWTGAKCKTCKGSGRELDRSGEEVRCNSCGGTGDDWGPMPDKIIKIGKYYGCVVVGRIYGVCDTEFEAKIWLKILQERKEA